MKPQKMTKNPKEKSYKILALIKKNIKKGKKEAFGCDSLKVVQLRAKEIHVVFPMYILSSTNR